MKLRDINIVVAPSGGSWLGYRLAVEFAISSGFCPCLVVCIGRPCNDLSRLDVAIPDGPTHIRTCEYFLLIALWSSSRPGLAEEGSSSHPTVEPSLPSLFNHAHDSPRSHIPHVPASRKFSLILAMGDARGGLHRSVSSASSTHGTRYSRISLLDGLLHPHAESLTQFDCYLSPSTRPRSLLIVIPMRSEYSLGFLCAPPVCFSLALANLNPLALRLTTFHPSYVYPSPNPSSWTYLLLCKVAASPT